MPHHTCTVKACMDYGAQFTVGYNLRETECSLLVGMWELLLVPLLCGQDVASLLEGWP